MHMSKRALALAATSVVVGVVGAGLAAAPANAAVLGDVTFSASSGSINDGPFLEWARSSGPCPTAFSQGASLDVVIDVNGNGSIDLENERFSLGPTLNEGGYDTVPFIQVNGIAGTARTLETRLQGRKGTFEIRISCLSEQFTTSPDYYRTEIIVEGDTWRLNEDVDPEPVEGTQEITTTVEQGEGQLTMTIGDDAQVTLPAPQLDGDRLSSEGDLDPVTVSDTRAGAPGWDTTAQVSEFSTGSAAFEGKYLGWTPAVVSSTATGVVAGATVAPGFSEGTGLSEPRQLAGAPAGSGTGSSQLGAGLSLEIPSDTAAGTYTATLTLTTI
ncbi:hypothetical protein [Jiangella alkaliphila]|uniref:WxL domain surface cell wall-binding n=1 Tax=Jiangella alkaliphila TaxID=419479 RepID=A0A1H2KW86_9ACTN|nr:hypothetical protein [Jiangella alkaliphila]SDU72990.1 hypothetical protein SAMN04488563_4448 [Jiangella alkaliphila]